MNLNQREIIIVSAGLVFVLLLGIYFFAISPLQKKRDNYRLVIVRLEETLSDIKVLANEYKTLNLAESSLRTKVMSRSKDFAPFSYLETLARQAGLDKKIESMTPITSGGDDGRTLAEIEVKMNAVGLGELVRFIYSVETSENVLFVTNLRIKPRYLDPTDLDVSLRVAAPLGN